MIPEIDYCATVSSERPVCMVMKYRATIIINTCAMHGCFHSAISVTWLTGEKLSCMDCGGKR